MKKRIARLARRQVAKVQAAAWKWFILTLRDILWRVDEWVHAEEVKLRKV